MKPELARKRNASMRKKNSGVEVSVGNTPLTIICRLNKGQPQNIAWEIAGYTRQPKEDNFHLYGYGKRGKW